MPIQADRLSQQYEKMAQDFAETGLDLKFVQDNRYSTQMQPGTAHTMHTLLLRKDREGVH